MLAYVAATQAGQMPALSPPTRNDGDGTLAMDAATRASLEITRARDGSTAHTLLAAVDRTLTAPGARMLAGWLSAPLTDPAAIAARQAGWLGLSAEPAALTALRTVLRGAPDATRALGRLSVGRGGPRDLLAIRQVMAVATDAAATLPPPKSPLALGEGGVRALSAGLTEARDPHPGPLPEGEGDHAGILSDLAQDLRLDTGLGARLAAALAASPPLRLDDGGAIAEGFDGELDGERRLRDDSRRVITGLQLDYAQRYGVASLKIRHHAQLGYVMEVPAAAAEALRSRPELSLRQSMANAARFTNPELAELDRRINEAAGRAAAREATVFAALVAEVLAQAQTLRRAAAALATLDVLQACAKLAESGSWCRPAVTGDAAFSIAAARHPVVEAALPGGTPFQPNDCDLSPARRVLLLTGPNMAGKSTFLRQNALLVILAQAGPAGAGRQRPHRRGRPPVQPRGRGRRPGPRPLHLHDGDDGDRRHPQPGGAAQPGRGGRDRARHRDAGRAGDRLGRAGGAALAHPLPNPVRHPFPRIGRAGTGTAANVPARHAVREWKNEIVFLHEVGEGAAGRSWGVHVAKLAGIPAATVRRAAGLLASLERGSATGPDLPLFAALPAAAPAPDRLRAALDGMEPDRLSPREALEALYQLKSLALSSAEC